MYFVKVVTLACLEQKICQRSYSDDGATFKKDVPFMKMFRKNVVGKQYKI